MNVINKEHVFPLWPTDNHIFNSTAVNERFHSADTAVFLPNVFFRRRTNTHLNTCAMILLKYLTASNLKIKLRMLASALMTSEIGESVVVSSYYFLQGCTLPPPSSRLKVVWSRKGRGGETTIWVWGYSAIFPILEVGRTNSRIIGKNMQIYDLTLKAWEIYV